MYVRHEKMKKAYLKNEKKYKKQIKIFRGENFWWYLSVLKDPSPCLPNVQIYLSNQLLPVNILVQSSPVTQNKFVLQTNQHLRLPR